jgi:phosphinothricin acetyltransferase
VASAVRADSSRAPCLFGSVREAVSQSRVRPAEQDDLPTLVEIYNHYVRTTHITFDTCPFRIDERRPWFASFSRSGPHRLFVSEVSNQVVGYASSSQFRAKPAYDTSVETTVYLDPDFVGRGIGERLYGALLDALQSEKSVHRAYGGIALPNERSIAIHKRFGFVLVGTFREIGFKFQKYWDVRWYEKDIADSHAA